MEDLNVREEPFPAKSKEASGAINGVATDVSSKSFSDKLLITISQEGRLSQWVRESSLFKNSRGS